MDLYVLFSGVDCIRMRVTLSVFLITYSINPNNGIIILKGEFSLMHEKDMIFLLIARPNDPLLQSWYVAMRGLEGDPV